MVVTAVAAVMAQTDNPQIGFWRMNIAKSTFSSGTGFKSATSRMQWFDGRVRHTVDSVYNDGTTRQYQYSTAYDGKDVPVVGNSPWGNTTAMTHVDKNTTRTIYKLNGKVTATQMSV